MSSTKKGGYSSLTDERFVRAMAEMASEMALPQKIDDLANGRLPVDRHGLMKFDDGFFDQDHVNPWTIVRQQADLLSWCRVVAMMEGGGPALGLHWVPSARSSGEPLAVYRTLPRWLAHGRDGIVPLDWVAMMELSEFWNPRTCRQWLVEDEELARTAALHVADEGIEVAIRRHV